MAVYNGEQYLADAIDGILRQTFGDFEFIVIDDGSTDGSAAILRRYAQQDARIRLISRSNRGLTPSLNEALRLARGEFIARMDGDDVALPHRFERQVAFLRANPQVVCVGADHELIDGAGRLLTVLRQPTDDATIQRLALRGQIALCHPVVLMRRSALEKVGRYDEDFPVAQDLDLWLRLGEVGELANISEVLLRYRQHETSVSEKKGQRQLEHMRMACERAWARRGLTDQQFERTQPWRAGDDRASRQKFALRYGWWAFNSGQRRTALHYGMKAALAMPWRADGWRLILCASLKPLPDRSLATGGKAGAA